MTNREIMSPLCVMAEPQGEMPRGPVVVVDGDLNAWLDARAVQPERAA